MRLPFLSARINPSATKRANSKSKIPKSGSARRQQRPNPTLNPTTTQTNNPTVKPINPRQSILTSSNGMIHKQVLVPKGLPSTATTPSTTPIGTPYPTPTTYPIPTTYPTTTYPTTTPYPTTTTNRTTTAYSTTTPYPTTTTYPTPTTYPITTTVDTTSAAMSPAVTVSLGVLAVTVNATALAGGAGNDTGLTDGATMNDTGLVDDLDSADWTSNTTTGALTELSTNGTVDVTAAAAPSFVSEHAVYLIAGSCGLLLVLLLLLICCCYRCYSRKSSQQKRTAKPKRSSPKDGELYSVTDVTDRQPESTTTREYSGEPQNGQPTGAEAEPLSNTAKLDPYPPAFLPPPPMPYANPSDNLPNYPETSLSSLQSSEPDRVPSEPNDLMPAVAALVHRAMAADRKNERRFAVQMTIKGDWKQALADPNTAAYTNLDGRLTAALKAKLDAEYGPKRVDVRVIGFEPGSIVANVEVVIRDKQGKHAATTDQQMTEELENLLKESVTAELASAGLRVSRRSIKAQPVPAAPYPPDAPKPSYIIGGAGSKRKSSPAPASAPRQLTATAVVMPPATAATLAHKAAAQHPRAKTDGYAPAVHLKLAADAQTQTRLTKQKVCSPPRPERRHRRVVELETPFDTSDETSGSKSLVSLGSTESDESVAVKKPERPTTRREVRQASTSRSSTTSSLASTDRTTSDEDTESSTVQQPAAEMSESESESFHRQSTTETEESPSETSGSRTSDSSSRSSQPPAQQPTQRAVSYQTETIHEATSIPLSLARAATTLSPPPGSETEEQLFEVEDPEDVAALNRFPEADSVVKTHTQAATHEHWTVVGATEQAINDYYRQRIAVHEALTSGSTDAPVVTAQARGSGPSYLTAAAQSSMAAAAVNPPFFLRQRPFSYDLKMPVIKRIRQQQRTATAYADNSKVEQSMLTKYFAPSDF